MARNRLRSMRVRRAEQREALTSPLRLEILEHLGAVGPAAVRELAARMNRSPHALHYHVRLMEGAGLLRRTGTVKSGPRDEALYDVVADRYEIDRPSAAREGLAPEAKTIRAVLRRAEREFTEALRSGRVRSQGEACFAGRLRARLSVQARQDVARHLAAIQRIFADELRRDQPPRGRPESCTFTAVYLQEPREKKRNRTTALQRARRPLV